MPITTTFVPHSELEEKADAIEQHLRERPDDYNIQDPMLTYHLVNEFFELFEEDLKDMTERCEEFFILMLFLEAYAWKIQEKMTGLKEKHKFWNPTVEQPSAEIFEDYAHKYLLCPEVAGVRGVPSLVAAIKQMNANVEDVLQGHGKYAEQVPEYFHILQCARLFYEVRIVPVQIHSETHSINYTSSIRYKKGKRPFCDNAKR